MILEEILSCLMLFILPAYIVYLIFFKKVSGEQVFKSYLLYSVILVPVGFSLGSIVSTIECGYETRALHCNGQEGMGVFLVTVVAVFITAVLAPFGLGMRKFTKNFKK